MAARIYCECKVSILFVYTLLFLRVFHLLAFVYEEALQKCGFLPLRASDLSPPWLGPKWGTRLMAKHARKKKGQQPEAKEKSKRKRPIQ